MAPDIPYNLQDTNSRAYEYRACLTLSGEAAYLHINSHPFRESFSREFSWVQCNIDVLNRVISVKLKLL